MGTNYYLNAPKCLHCGVESHKPIHLGKSSAGWCFGLHVRPKDGISNWGDCYLFIVQSLKRNWYIVDEYDNTWTLKQFVEAVTDRSTRREPSSAWLQANHACAGPNNLARHIIDGKRCIGHGEGTYDYIVGEFS